MDVWVGVEQPRLPSTAAPSAVCAAQPNQPILTETHGLRRHNTHSPFPVPSTPPTPPTSHPTHRVKLISTALESPTLADCMGVGVGVFV